MKKIIKIINSNYLKKTITTTTTTTKTKTKTTSELIRPNFTHLLFAPRQKSLDYHLDNLFNTLKHPIKSQSQSQSQSQSNQNVETINKTKILNSNDFETIQKTKPELLKNLSPKSLEAFISYLLASRFDSFTLSFIEEINKEISVFTTYQRITILRILIRLSRTKRQWLTPEDKELVFVSDGAITNYFKQLLKLVKFTELHGLGAEDLRCVMRSLRRSSSPLFCDANLIRYIWQEIIKTESNDNRRTTNARLGIRSILYWVSNPNPTPQLANISQPTPAIWSLCLQIWSQLIDWGEIIHDDLIPSIEEEENNILSPVDLAILTMLTPIIRSASRRYSALPLNRDHIKLFKNACEALEFLLTRSSSIKISSVVEHLIPQLVHTFLRVFDIDHRVPAPEIIRILIQYPTLPTVTERWSQEGISEQDYQLFEQTLDTLHTLGRANLLVDFWIDLLPLINVAKAGWPLSKLLTSLEELSNPLVRAISGKPLNGFRFARLILKVIKVLEAENDSRLVPSRRQAFRLLVERQDLHSFDWLSREERQFDRDGIEIKLDSNNNNNLKSSDLIDENIQTLFQLWESSWGLSKRLISEKDGEPLPLPLPTLIGVTKLTQMIRNDKTILLLKMVISKFVADRTPALTEEEMKSKYLINPKMRINDIERTKIIETHLTIGSSLSKKFLIEIFNDFLLFKIVPSVEDLKFLHSFLLLLEPEKAVEFWKDNAALVNGLPWDLFQHHLAYPVGWDLSRIQLAKHVFVDKPQIDKKNVIKEDQ